MSAAVLAASACTSPPPPVPPAVPSASPQSSVKPPPPPELALFDGIAFVDRRKVAELQEHRPEINQAFKQRLAERNPESWATEPLTLQIDSAAQVHHLYSVLQSAAAAGYPLVRSKELDRRVLFHGILPIVPQAPIPKDLRLLQVERPVLAIEAIDDVVRVKLLLLPEEASAPRIKSLADMPLDAIEAQLPGILSGPDSEGTLARSVVISVETGESLETLLRLLDVAVVSTGTNADYPLNVQLRLGSLRNAGSKSHAMRLTPPIPSSDLEPRRLDETFENYQQGFLPCLVSAGERDGGVTGRSNLKLTVSSEGAVSGVDTDADSTLSDPELVECMKRQMATWQIPLQTPKAGTIRFTVSVSSGG